MATDDGKKRPSRQAKGFTLPAALRLAFQGGGGGSNQAAPPPPEWPEIDPAASELPVDCPVTALGVQGRGFFYLNSAGQLVQLTDHEHGKHALLGLFGGAVAYLEKVWPKYGPPNAQGVQQISGVRWDLVEQCLMLECNRQGVWNPLHRMRGPGAWSDENDRLIMHYGDEIQIGGEAFPPGAIGDYIYEAGPKWPHPAEVLAPGGPQGPGRLTLDLLQSWNWRNPDRDPWLKLGHIGASKIGGALHWRPTVWTVGPPGSGKTTMETKLEAPLYGRDGAIQLIDPSEAAVRQITRYASLPVKVDELEPGARQHRVQQVVALARHAASGGITARGSAGHVAHQFTLRSCFGFSSVYSAPLNAQDRTRIAILELLPLAEGAILPDFSPKRIADLGRLLTRRLVEQWPRLPHVFDCYAQALRRSGHDARGCDQYGTLASIAFILLHDDEPSETPVPAALTDQDDLNPVERLRYEEDRRDILKSLRPDDLAFWVHRFRATQLAEENDDVPDSERCLNHLLGSLVDPRRAGERRTVGQALKDEIVHSRAKGELFSVASDLLDALGLRLRLQLVPDENLSPEQRARGPVWEPYLVVANNHRGLYEIFNNSAWAGSPETGGAGWVQAVRRIPGAEAVDPMWFGSGVKSRGTTLSLKSQFGLKFSKGPGL